MQQPIFVLVVKIITNPTTKHLRHALIKRDIVNNTEIKSLII